MQRENETPPAVGAVLVAAGRSERFGDERPKQFLPLQERPLFLHSLAVLAAAAEVHSLVLVVTPGWEATARQDIAAAGLATRVPSIVPGGATRQESVWRGLQALPETELVLVHDAARPFLTAALVARAVAAARRSGAATLALPLRDTLMRGDGRSPAGAAAVVERDGVWAVQTPQVFARELLLSAHAQARRDGVAASDDGTLILGLRRTLELVPGAWWNIKVTEPADLELAHWILRSRPPVSGEPGAPRARQNPASRVSGHEENAT